MVRPLKFVFPDKPYFYVYAGLLVLFEESNFFHLINVCYEEFEDTKGAIRNRISK
jgi:hypothetical protein